MFDHDPVYIAIEMEVPETLRVMEFQTSGRSLTLPHGARWMKERDGWWEREATDENVFVEIMRACPVHGYAEIPLPQPVRWFRVSLSDIPTDRTYRDALVHDGEKLTHDMEKARAIHLTRIRAARTRMLGELDGQWMRATGQKDTQAAEEIERQRQALRDVTKIPELAHAQSLEEITALWPRDLPRD